MALFDIRLVALGALLAGCIPGTPQDFSDGIHQSVQTVTDAAKVLSGSLRQIKSDIEQRTGNIVQGAAKIKEGKEQMEEGIRWE
ncbi:hypothetical protein FJZ27_02090 [Candidatus Peribacteria bacterium]|nr:hypothetical protein [Candidatus Peribacteria bacterium]